MKKEIATKWTAKLRDPEIQQGHSVLCNVRKDGAGNITKNYCCLGVLCEVAIENGLDITVEDRFDAYDRGERTYNEQDSYLPESVQEWAGMHSNSGESRRDSDGNLQRITVGGIDGYGNLAEANDDSATFPEIADWIDEHYEEL